MKKFGKELEGQRADYIFAIDVSGTMNKYKDTVVPALGGFFKSLQEGDYVSIIKFGGEAINEVGSAGKIGAETITNLINYAGHVYDTPTTAYEKEKYFKWTDLDNMLHYLADDMKQIDRSRLKFVFIITDFLHDPSHSRRGNEDWGGVKKAVHNFVQSARYLHSIGEPYAGRGLLSWRFVGSSGTGKSTVAEIMAGILRGMRLITNSHITEVRGERILGVPESESDEVLREAVKKSCNGLIFIDMDDPKFSDDRLRYGRSIEQIRLKVKELTVEAGGECALILAELHAPNGDVAEQLTKSGVYEFDHTLIFKDFKPEELYQILAQCLDKFHVSFTPEAEKHIRAYIGEMCGTFNANARTMKLMSRTIYQQVILRESALPKRPSAHVVELADVQTFKWDGKKGKIGF